MTSTTPGVPAAGVAAGQGSGGRSSRWVLWALIAVALVAVAVVAGGPRSEGRALDPDSTDPFGTKALVLLLRESGADVEVRDTTPDRSTDVAVLLSDSTDLQMTDELERWVEQGGTLVVADPRSSFTPRAADSTELFGVINASIPRGNCSIAALDRVDRVDPAGAGAFYEIPTGASGCFDREDAGAFVVDVPTGEGHVVSVGSPTVFVNEALGSEDNAVLAVDLMAPSEGTRVAVLWGMQGADAAEPTVSDLISTGVRLAFLQLLVAFVLYAWWRGRRLGAPVAEPQPVQIAGSELVAAVGNLLQQTRDPDRAARLLRSDLRRRLCERLGLPPTATPDVIADVTAARAGVERDRVARAVADTPVRSEDELLDLARDIDIIRTEVFHGTAP